MPMPSLFRYFLVVGSALLGLLLLANHMLEPPAAAVAAVAPVKIAVRHDPRASIIERWRNEQAARKAAERGEPTPVIAAAAPEPATPVSEPSPTRPEPPQIVAPVALHTAPAAAAALPDGAAEARKAEQAQAAQARRARIARERAKREQQQQQEAASRQQDQFYYGASRRAYAEPPAFAPFGGRTW